MKFLRLLMMVGLVVAATPGNADPATRFVAVDVFMTATVPVAAWQFELANAAGTMQVVGVERGDSDAYPRAPYYDREAVRLGQADRIVVADFSLAAAAELPSGRVRIATVHLLWTGESTEDLTLTLVTAAEASGNTVAATLDMRLQTGREQ